ncbi:MAG: protein kinase [Gemmatimonadales bacterium]|jgi:serine/threonine-protein kinase|nr:MAG: protein kinase [Gemmatimonadales bacterium]
MTDIPSRLNAALQGRYRIERKIGEGGMASVYLARDLKHERDVAIKVLRPDLAAMMGAERFLGEIRTTANLQHPHILPLFDSGEADGFLYYVMPYVRGESLRAQLDREKQLAVDEAVRIARAVAAALDYAHRHGVIHRDIKPANILLHDGEPQVADFGIALAVQQAGGGRLTETGLSLGTPFYMSPEQATGDRDPDPRSDLYSLGCVTYEMLAGEPPFTGGSAQSVLAKILTGEAPRVTTVRSTVPPNVSGAVARATQRIPADRFPSAGDYGAALADPNFRFTGGTHEGAAAVPGGAGTGEWSGGNGLGLGGRTSVSQALSRWRLLAVAGVALSTVLGATLLMGTAGDESGTSAGDSLPVAQMVFGALQGQEIVDEFYNVASFSADGARLVYAGRGETGPQLWLREQSEYWSRPIPGTAGAGTPVVSPDGEWVAFQAGGEIRKVRVTGGPTVVVGDSAFSEIGGIAWLPDGRVAYVDARFNIRIVDQDGGRDFERIYEREQSEILISLLALPTGNLLFLRCQGLCQTGSQLVGWDAGTGEFKVVDEGSVGAWWVDSGHLILALRTGDVLGIRFDPQRLERLGDPVALMENVQVDQQVVPDMTVSESGRLLARIGGEDAAILTLFEFDRSGVRRMIDPDFSFLEPVFGSVRISPDGSRATFTQGGDAGDDVWVKELDAGPAYRLTFDDATDFRSEWTPDGESLLFISERGGRREVFLRPANGTGAAERVLSRPTDISQAVYSPDGEWLVYREGTAEGRDIWVVGPGPDAEPRALIADGGYDEKAPAISPDGRWIAYESDESGQNEVYVRPFPDVTSGKWRISVAGGTHPAWGHNGRELFYVDANLAMMVASLNPGPPFSVLDRRMMFEVSGGSLTQQDHTVYAVSPDDGSFVFALPRESIRESEVFWIIVDNWATELKRLIPAENE